MSSLYANVVNELEKIFIKKKNLFFLVIAALIPIGVVLTFLLAQNTLGLFAITAGGFPIFILGIITNLFLPIMVFSVATEIFTGEIGDRTLKLTLLRPISRFTVFLSKTISLGIFIVVNLGVVLIVSVISSLFLKQTQAFSGLGEVLLAYITAFVPMLCLSIGAVFLAQFFKNTVGALTSCIFVYVAGKLVPFISPALSRIMPFSYTDWHLLWLGSTVGPGKLLNVFTMLLAYCLVAFSVGFYLFDQKDL